MQSIFDFRQTKLAESYKFISPICQTFDRRHYFSDFYKFAQPPQRDNLYGRGTQQTLSKAGSFPRPYRFSLCTLFPFHPTLFTLLYMFVWCYSLDFYC